MKTLKNLRLCSCIIEQLQYPIARKLPGRRHFSSKQVFDRIKQSTQHQTRSSWRPNSTRRIFQRFWQMRFQSNQNTTPPPKPNVTANLGSPDSSLSISQRMRKLSREYGWAAFGIYMGLSALDFPFCFLAVRALGTERIGHWEHEIIHGFWQAVTYPFPQLAKYAPASLELDGGAKKEIPAQQDGAVGQPAVEWSWGVEEAEQNYEADATIWTQLALAYAVHKSFIFLRVPLTVAVTPKVVKTLRGWGWNIGKRKPKSTPSSSSSSSSSSA